MLILNLKLVLTIAQVAQSVVSKLECPAVNGQDNQRRLTSSTREGALVS